jgi:hypothetical protein
MVLDATQVPASLRVFYAPDADLYAFAMAGRLKCAPFPPEACFVDIVYLLLLVLLVAGSAAFIRLCARLEQQ